MELNTALEETPVSARGAKLGRLRRRELGVKEVGHVHDWQLVGLVAVVLAGDGAGPGLVAGPDEPLGNLDGVGEGRRRGARDLVPANEPVVVSRLQLHSLREERQRESAGTRGCASRAQEVIEEQGSNCKVALSYCPIPIERKCCPIAEVCCHSPSSVELWRSRIGSGAAAGPTSDCQRLCLDPQKVVKRVTSDFVTYCSTFRLFVVNIVLS